MITVTLQVKEFGVGNYKPLVVTSDVLEVEVTVEDKEVTKFDEDGKGVRLTIEGLKSVYKQLNSIFMDNIVSTDDEKSTDKDEEDEWE